MKPYFALLLVVFFSAQELEAVTWQVGTGNWSVGTNWNGGEPLAATLAQIGNSGTAQITSAGEVASTLQIGHSSTNAGNGALEISGGDLTLTGDMFLGAAGSRTGTVTQTSGVVNIGGDFKTSVDGSANGIYMFTGGSFNLTGGSSNFNIGRDGTFTHDNAAHTLTVPGNFNLGSIGAGTATFNLLAGTLATQGAFILGENSGNNAIFNLAAGATLTLGAGQDFNMKGQSSFTNPVGHTLAIPNNLLVGSATGQAVFTIAGGTVTIGSEMRIAPTGSTETVADEVNYNGGTLTFLSGSGKLTIGRTGTFNHNVATTTAIPSNLEIGNIGAGTATVNILQGTMNVGGDVLLGVSSGNNGLLNISPGASLVLSGASSNFNMRGTSSYTNQNGHALTVPGFLDVGTSTGKAVFTLASGTVSVGNDLRVANTGSTEVIDDEFNLNGGTLTFTGPASKLTIGRTGTINLDAPITTSVPGNVEIGNIGAGVATLNILQGTLDVGADFLLGVSSGNNGLLNISPGASLVLSGASSNFNMRGTSSYTNQNGHVLTIPGQLDVGSATGKAVFTLQSGTVNVANDLRIAPTGSTEAIDDEFILNGGTLNLTGGTSSITIGRTGTFTHNKNGTTFVPGLVHIGNVGAGVATMNLNAGTLEVNGNVTLGTNTANSGTLNVAAGATLKINGSSDLILTSNTLVSTAGQIQLADSLILGSAAGTSVFTQTGGLVSAANMTISSISTNTGTYNLDGGALNLLGTLNLNGNPGTATFNLNGGTLSASTVQLGTDTFNYTSGFLSPGLINNPATMIFNGNLLMPSAGGLQMDLVAPETLGGPNDLLVVNGDLQLDGVLSVSSAPVGIFPIITFTGDLTGPGLSVLFPLTQSIFVEFNEFGGGTVFLQVIPIPEPSSMLLVVGLGLMGLNARRRQRKSQA